MNFMIILRKIDRYEQASYLDLTFTKPTNARDVGRYIASQMEYIVGQENVREMNVADEESLVATPNRDRHYFEIHTLNKSKTSFRCRQFFGSDEETASHLLQLAVNLGPRQSQ